MRYRRSKRFRVNLLKLSGYRCDECGSGWEAWKCITNQPLYQGGNDTADNCRVVLCIDCHISRSIERRPVSNERRAWRTGRAGVDDMKLARRSSSSARPRVRADLANVGRR